MTSNTKTEAGASMSEAAKQCDLIGQAIYMGKTKEAYRMLDELRQLLATPQADAAPSELPDMPANAGHVTRRIRRCESETAAQLVLEHFAMGYARAAIAAGGAQETAAARDVLAERQRQVNAEGWTPEHDDAHDSGQLAGAASCYAAHVNGRQWVFFDGRHDDYKSEPTPDYWPWDESWWKPTTPRRDLVKAGALILAEIERLDRAAASNGEQA